MFNDERITYEISKLKKLIIIISFILGLLFSIYKIYCATQISLKLCYYSTEIIITILSLGILIGSLFIKSDVKDELYFAQKANYYNIAFKILLYVSFISYAIVMPATLINEEGGLYSSSSCINTIMMAALFIGYGYLRLKRVYFNYNIIETNAKTYYKNVFINILKLMGFFGIIYGIALVVSLFYKDNILLIIIAIVIAYVVSIISNGIYYLLISFLERLFYKEENKKIITTPSFILIIISLVFLLITLSCNLIYSYIVINVSPNKWGGSAALSVIVNSERYYTSLCRFFSALTITFLVSDICKNDLKLIKKAKLVTIILISALILFNVNQLISPGLNYIFSAYNKNLIDYTIKLLVIYRNVIAILTNSVYILIGILIFILFRKDMKKAFGLKISLILWVLLYLIRLLVYIFNKTNVYYLYIYIAMISLTILLLVYAFIVYFKKNNNIVLEENEFN